jgi:hypothetical protein
MYHVNFITKVKQLPLTLGVRLGRWAIYHDISVTDLARASGATRQTVYNWMHGGEITPSYRNTVERLVSCLQSSKSTEEAWRKICTDFNLAP